MTADPYRTDHRRRLRVLETVNGHVMAMCRDDEGRITYVCVHCGRETINTAIGLDNVRTPHSIPLDACPNVVLDGAPWQGSEQGWFAVGDPERAPFQERVTGHALWRRRRENSRNP